MLLTITILFTRCIKKIYITMGPKVEKKKPTTRASETDMNMQECNSETEFSINMTQLQTMIESAVKKAMESFGLTEDISKAQEARLDKIVSDQSALENQVSTLNNTVEVLSKDVTSLSATIQQQKATIAELQSKIIKSTLWANSNEQYSRKHNIKISGLSIADDPVPVAVTKFLKQNLKVDIKNGDIDVAHPVKSRHPRLDRNGMHKTDMVLVKFSNLQVRNDVIQRRKQLKGSGTVILEDLTRLNVELLHRLKNNKHIKQSWSWNGRVFGSTSDGRKVQFDPFDCIEDKITSTDN